MASDVFIGYDVQDEKIAEDICNFLENNNKTCWIKKRDFNEEEDTVYKITEAIKSSKCFVLIYSKDSNDSNYVITDLDIAFGSNVPIIVFKIDDSAIADKQEFYIKEKPIINAYPNARDYYGQLDEGISELITSSSSESSLQNEAYVCCCEEDVLAGDAICHVLEENGIKCWFKKRDFLVNDSSEKIIESIKNSKCFILVHSKDAINSSNVISEINYAISNNIPILSFKIEESENLDNLENAHWLEAYPKPEEKFNNLVIDTANLIGKQVSNPKITKKYNIEKKRI